MYEWDTTWMPDVCACFCVRLCWQHSLLASFDRYVNACAQGRGLIVLLAGGGILQKPAASNTGSNSRTRPGMLPSIILSTHMRWYTLVIVFGSFVLPFSAFSLDLPSFLCGNPYGAQLRQIRLGWKESRTVKVQAILQQVIVLVQRCQRDANRWRWCVFRCTCFVFFGNFI